jgi:hypothetical protein
MLGKFGKSIGSLRTGARLGHVVEALQTPTLLAKRVQFDTSPSTLTASAVTVPLALQAIAAIEASPLLQMQVSFRSALLAPAKKTTPTPPTPAALSVMETLNICTAASSAASTPPHASPAASPRNPPTLPRKSVSRITALEKTKIAPPSSPARFSSNKHDEMDTL